MDTAQHPTMTFDVNFYTVKTTVIDSTCKE